MEYLQHLTLFQRILLAMVCLLGAFLAYVSMTSKFYKGRQMTLLEKIKIYFHKCPCGDTIESWGRGKYKCYECGEDYKK